MQAQVKKKNNGIKDRPYKRKEVKSILILDMHPLLRQGLKLVIELEEYLKVVGEASTTDETIHLIKNAKPDLLIIDIALPGFMSGIELIWAINNLFPEVRILVLTMYDETFIAERAMRAGARGYVTKEVASKEIIDAINAVLNDEFYLSENISRKLINRFVCGSEESIGRSVDSLSNREFEIFKLVGKGFTCIEIARMLNLSSYTIYTHKKNIKEKLHLKCSTDLAKSAIQWTLAWNR